jgi:hypothetical protein
MKKMLYESGESVSALLVDYIARLQGILDSVPEDQRPKVQIDIFGGEGGYYGIETEIELVP